MIFDVRESQKRSMGSSMGPGGPPLPPGDDLGTIDFVTDFNDIFVGI